MKSILIIRLSAIGDVVMASPMIAALRKTYPDCKLSWLVEPAQAALLEENKQLDEVIIWPKSRWKQLWRQRQYLSLLKEVKAFVQLLRKREFDLALDCQGLLKSGVWAYLSGAPRRIGLGSKEGSRIFMTETLDPAAFQRDRISSEYLFLMDYLGCDTKTFAMEVAQSEKSIAHSRELLISHGLGNNYVVFCPFTTRPQKHWLNTHWLQLATELESYKLPCVVLGSPQDKEAAEVFVEHKNIYSLVGKTSLQEAAAIIDKAVCLVGVDTGLTHMGHAVGTPTVAIFGSTRPYLDAGVETGRVIYHAMSCSPCRRHPTCNGRFDCMRSISVQDVLVEMRSLIRFG